MAGHGRYQGARPQAGHGVGWPRRVRLDWLVSWEGGTGVCLAPGSVAWSHVGAALPGVGAALPRVGAALLSAAQHYPKSAAEPPTGASMQGCRPPGCIGTMSPTCMRPSTSAAPPERPRPAAPGAWLGDRASHRCLGAPRTPRPTRPYCTSPPCPPLPLSSAEEKWKLPFVWQGSDRAGLFDKALTLCEHAEKLNPGPFDNLHCFAAKKKKKKNKKKEKKKGWFDLKLQVHGISKRNDTQRMDLCDMGR